MSLNLSAAWLTVQRMLTGFAAALPRVILGLVLIGVFYLVAKGVRAVIRRNAQRRGEHRTLELAIGRLAQAGIVVLGVLIAVTATFPSFTPANLVSTLGIGGVAVGFAFKDIFQNFLAGLLILVTRPFRVGDQIRTRTTRAPSRTSGRVRRTSRATTGGASSSRTGSCTRTPSR